MQKEFLYFITSENGLCYYVAPNGSVQQGRYIPLKHTPNGWMEQSIQFQRNSTYKALFRQFTTPMKFVLDGAKILRHLFYNVQGIETPAYLVIVKLNPTTGQHNDYYKGEIDFSTIKDSLDFVEVALLEAGLAKLIKANENTLYEFDLNCDETVQVRMDGLELQNAYHYIIPNIGVDLDTDTGESFDVPVSFVNKEGDNYGVAGLSSMLARDYAGTLDNPFFETQFGFDVNIAGQLVVSPNRSGNMKVSFVVMKAGAVHQRIYIANESTAIGGQLYTYSINQPITLPDGASIKMQGELSAGSGDARMYFGETTIDLTFTYKYKETYVPGLTAFDLFRKLIQKLSSVSFSTVSQLLASRTDIVYTSGDGIRNLPAAKIKISLSSFFKSVDCLFHIGMEVNGLNAVLEPRQYFFDANTSILNLGDVESCTLTVDTEDIFNTIKIGYASKDTKFDAINGKYEFNTTHQYTTPITRLPKSLELVNPARADMYGIEVVRINLDAKKTTDSSSDNEVFILNAVDENPAITFSFETGNSFYVDNVFPIVPGRTYTISGTASNNGVFRVISVVPFTGLSGSISNLVTTVEATVSETLVTGTISGNFKKLYRKVYTSITGLLFPASAFNIELSPKRCLFAHGPFIRSVMHKLDSKQIVFQTTDKNPELSTRDGAIIRKEKGNVNIGDLGDPYFQPYVFNVRTAVPINFAELMANTKGYIDFTWNGSAYKGFLLAGEIQPATLESKEFKLLSHLANDLTKMIHG